MVDASGYFTVAPNLSDRGPIWRLLFCGPQLGLQFPRPCQWLPCTRRRVHESGEGPCRKNGGGAHVTDGLLPLHSSPAGLPVDPAGLLDLLLGAKGVLSRQLQQPFGPKPPLKRRRLRVGLRGADRSERL